MTSHSDSEISSRKEAVMPFIKKDFKFKVKSRMNYNDSFLKNFEKMMLPSPAEKKLLLSVQLNNVENVERLLSEGVSPNSSDEAGRSALHIAASRGYSDITKLLLQYGAEPNIQDIKRNTPLHLAACNSNLQIITLLINGGADIRCLDINGKNPLQLAEGKLQLLISGRKTGAVEILSICAQVQEIVDIMISLWKRKDSTSWGHHRENVDDLEMLKLSLNNGSGGEEVVDDQMSKLLSELQQFSI